MGLQLTNLQQYVGGIGILCVICRIASCVKNSLNLVEFNFSKMKITPLGILSSILEGLPNEVVDRNKDTIDWEFV